MVKIEYELAKPDELEAVLTIRMKVGEFKELKEQLSEKHPSWKLTSAIRELISKAEQTFEKRIES